MSRSFERSQRNLPLPTTSNEGFEEGSFLRLNANAQAYDSLRAWHPRAWAGGQSRVFAICGAAKSGKSHLGEIWRSQFDARTITPRFLQQSQDITSLAESFLWLDVAGDYDLTRAGVLGDLFERQLYALYNEITQGANSALLITARLSPASWHITLADLRSRMRAVACSSILDPDDEDSACILEKIFRARQLEVDQRVYPYLLRRIERSFLAHHEIAEQLDSLSLTHKRKITVPFLSQNLRANGLR